MHGDKKIGWNNEVAKRQTREQFVSDHPHIADEAGKKWDDTHKDDTKPTAKAKVADEAK